MKKIASLLIVCIVFSLFCVVAMADNPSSYVDNDIFNGTRFRDGECADPWVTYHDGYYYATRTGATQVPVYKAATLEGLFKVPTNNSIVYNSALDSTVTTLFGSGATINGTWSPEVHYFSEEDFPESSGWYMYLALRQNYDDPTGESSRIRMVVLKSTGDDATDTFGHPVSLTENKSEPLRDSDGSIHDTWGCGQTILRITEGEYAGIYAMWVEENGRGTADFYQIIRIAKLKTPWQLDSDVCTITTPTQDWEMSGKRVSSTKYLPNVVEGATPVYGKNGEIFLVYSGSGYWTGGNYALGQLTWTGGDPLDQNSWVKLPVENGNPIFDAKNTGYTSGAGHSCFIQDKDGNGFAVYHVYFTSHGDAGTKRRACIEPYYIDYTEPNGTGYGVVHIGANDNGMPADWYNTVVKVTSHSGEYLSKPSASGDYYSAYGTELVMQDDLVSNATEAGRDAGFIIYRKALGEDFYSYYDTTSDTVYNDEDVEEGGVYSYRIYSYREEEISPSYAEVNVTILSAPTLSVLGDRVKITITCDCTGISVFRDGEWAESFNGNFSAGGSITWPDSGFTPGATHTYTAVAMLDESISEMSNKVKITYLAPAPEIREGSISCSSLEILIDNQTTAAYDYFNIFFGEESLSKIGETNTLSYTVDNLAVGTTYYYAVAGVANGTMGSLSEVYEYTPMHSYDFYFESKEPTCTEYGYEEYFACEGGDVMGEKVTVEPTGHSYVLTEPEIPATKETEGKTAVYTCSACNDSYGGEVIPTIGSGDINNDGTLSVLDVILALRNDIYTPDADMNGNGKIDLLDVLILIKAILNS